MLLLISSNPNFTLLQTIFTIGFYQKKKLLNVYSSDFLILFPELWVPEFWLCFCFCFFFSFLSIARTVLLDSSQINSFLSTPIFFCPIYILEFFGLSTFPSFFLTFYIWGPPLIDPMHSCAPTSFELGPTTTLQYSRFNLSIDFITTRLHDLLPLDFEDLKLRIIIFWLPRYLSSRSKLLHRCASIDCHASNGSWWGFFFNQKNAWELYSIPIYFFVYGGLSLINSCHWGSPNPKELVHILT